MNELGYWFGAQDADERGLGLYRRHYSRRVYRDGRNPRLFVGPGQKMVLLNTEGTALFVWRKFIDRSGQQGVNCAVFRYENPRPACRNSGHSHCPSRMIHEADTIAWQRWPGERHYTYVNPKKIASSNPGYCFKRAGWKFIGRTKRGLHILAIEAPVEKGC